MTSGIIDLVLSDDGKVLRDLVADLNVTCQDYFRTRGTNEITEEQQIPAINGPKSLIDKDCLTGAGRS